MKCKLKTLTPCHIGSGNILIKDLDFVVDGKGDDKTIGIISSDKIYKVLGEQGIDRWCQAIDRRESIWRVVKTMNPNERLENICSRVTPLSGDVCTELREQIASNGVHYIPGSSIKGAIVSAIVGECRNNIAMPNNVRNGVVAEQVLVRPTTNQQGITRYDPKNSNLRFLRVGDAYFKNADIAVVECYGLNIRARKSIIDKNTRMLVECINYEEETTVNIHLATDLQNMCGSNVPPLPSAMQSEANLLDTVNAHTKRLLREELSFWCEQDNRAYYHIDTDEEQEELDYYLGEIKSIISECNRCQCGCEAIIRIGYGSGWRFMTGSWIDGNDGALRNIASIVRRDRNGAYRQYDFPKTRRVGLGSPFGFIKITKIG